MLVKILASFHVNDRPFQYYYEETNPRTPLFFTPRDPICTTYTVREGAPTQMEPWFLPDAAEYSSI